MGAEPLTPAQSGRKPGRDMAYLRIVTRGIAAMLLMLAAMFLLAGRVNYWQGWVFSLASVARIVIASLLFAGHADLIKERMKPGPGTKWWDRVFYAIYVPLMLGILILGALDSGRFRWSPPLAWPMYAAGVLMHGAAHALNVWAMWENRFFSSTVRLQTDRGQQVILTGPYAFVRHPGYVGGILLAVSMALVLDSAWALAPALATIPLLAVRTFLEDRTLQRELPGYAEYASRVKYRLLPGVW
jgi:protein-S-isoprenylcysteine O-methyltransferase Ste14